MLKDWFGKSKYVTVKKSEAQKKKEKEAKESETQEEKKRDDQLWTKCKECEGFIFNKKLAQNLMVCPKCGYHFRLTAIDRLRITVDENSFVEFGGNINTGNPLDFPGYDEKLEKAEVKTGIEEAVITGEAAIGGFPVVIGVMDFYFMGGSMGSAVGEKITRAIEKAITTSKPLVIFSAAGGARMQEGMLSLMQMAKTSAALKKLQQEKVLFISVLTDPTSGGVTASYASLGDIILAEPGALIAFAGPRVIKQTISKKLPEGFQRAEFLLEHGMVDQVVERENMQNRISRILKIHRGQEEF
ncbi:MAG: acetyl-CoA carboxylase, carboxyltransferase subunit beta [Halanaerobiaceae bacterium]